MLKLKYLAISIISVLSITLAGPAFDAFARPLAQDAPELGKAERYSVLAYSEVTNTGPTTMSGDLGVSPGTSISGFPPGMVNPPGAIRNTAHAAEAQFDADVARLALASQGPGLTLTSDLTGETLAPGVYTVPGVSLLTGLLTLNGDGVYIFLTDGLTTSGTVSFINGADACDVYWLDASSVSITGGDFVGTIIALASITMDTGATLEGRAIAQNGAVTLDTNTFTTPVCETASPDVPAATATPTTVATPTGFPDSIPPTGGAPIRNEGFPWSSLVIVGGLSAIALVFGIRAYRSSTN